MFRSGMMGLLMMMINEKLKTQSVQEISRPKKDELKANVKLFLYLTLTSTPCRGTA